MAIRDVSLQYAAMFAEAAEEEKKYEEACQEACREAEEAERKAIDEFDVEEVDPSECGFQEAMSPEEIMKMWKDKKREEKTNALVPVDNNYINTMKKLLSGIKSSKRDVYARVMQKLAEYMQSKTQLPPPEDFAENFIPFEEICRGGPTPDSEDYSDTEGAFGNDMADQNLWDSEDNEVIAADGISEAEVGDGMTVGQLIPSFEDCLRAHPYSPIHVGKSLGEYSLYGQVVSIDTDGPEVVLHVVRVINGNPQDKRLPMVKASEFYNEVKDDSLMLSKPVVAEVKLLGKSQILPIMSADVADRDGLMLRTELPAQGTSDGVSESACQNEEDPVAHLMDPVGVKASTANLAGQDAVGMSVVESLLKKIDKLEKMNENNHLNKNKEIAKVECLNESNSELTKKVLTMFKNFYYSISNKVGLVQRDRSEYIVSAEINGKKCFIELDKFSESSGNLNLLVTFDGEEHETVDSFIKKLLKDNAKISKIKNITIDFVQWWRNFGINHKAELVDSKVEDKEFVFIIRRLEENNTDPDPNSFFDESEKPEEITEAAYDDAQAKQKLKYEDQLKFKRWAMRKLGLKGDPFYFDYVTGVDAETGNDLPGLIADGSMTWGQGLDALKSFFGIQEEENPDDAKADDFDFAGDEYEDQQAALSGLNEADESFEDDSTPEDNAKIDDIMSDKKSEELKRAEAIQEISFDRKLTKAEEDEFRKILGKLSDYEKDLLLSNVGSSKTGFARPGNHTGMYAPDDAGNRVEIPPYNYKQDPDDRFQRKSLEKRAQKAAVAKEIQTTQDNALSSLDKNLEVGSDVSSQDWQVALGTLKNKEKRQLMDELIDGIEADYEGKDDPESKRAREQEIWFIWKIFGYDPKTRDLGKAWNVSHVGAGKYYRATMKKIADAFRVAGIRKMADIKNLDAHGWKKLTDFLEKAKQNSRHWKIDQKQKQKDSSQEEQTDAEVAEEQ